MILRGEASSSSFSETGGSATVSGSSLGPGLAGRFELQFTISPQRFVGALTIGNDGSLPGGQPMVFTLTSATD